MILDPDTCDHDAHEFIHDPDTYVYDAFINVPRSLTLMHVCMMHISMILDLDSDAFMYVSFLTVMFVCMCDAQILDPDTCDHDAHTYYALIHDPDTCVYDAFIMFLDP